MPALVISLLWFSLNLRGPDPLVLSPMIAYWLLNPCTGFERAFSIPNAFQEQILSESYDKTRVNKRTKGEFRYIMFPRDVAAPSLIAAAPFFAAILAAGGAAPPVPRPFPAKTVCPLRGSDTGRRWETPSASMAASTSALHTLYLANCSILNPSKTKTSRARV